MKRSVNDEVTHELVKWRGEEGVEQLPCARRVQIYAEHLCMLGTEMRREKKSPTSGLLVGFFFPILFLKSWLGFEKIVC